MIFTVFLLSTLSRAASESRVGVIGFKSIPVQTLLWPDQTLKILSVETPGRYTLGIHLITLGTVSLDADDWILLQLRCRKCEAPYVVVPFSRNTTTDSDNEVRRAVHHNVQAVWIHYQLGAGDTIEVVRLKRALVPPMRRVHRDRGKRHLVGRVEIKRG